MLLWFWSPVSRGLRLTPRDLANEARFDIERLPVSRLSIHNWVCLFLMLELATGCDCRLQLAG